MNESMKLDASDDPRVRYAIERTLLAWVRTGLALMGFGFVVARLGLFLHEIEAVRHNAMPKASTGLSLWIGTALILLGVGRQSAGLGRASTADAANPVVTAFL